MLARLLFLFVLVPFVELVILLRVGAVLHVGPTLGLIVLTGVIGAALARRQGVRTLQRINAELSAGRMPTSELADGALILLAGAVLITPGFLTDAFGLALLVPAFRSRFKQAMTRYFQSRIVVGGFQPGPGPDFVDPQDTPFGAGPRSVKYVKNEAIDETKPPPAERAADRARTG